MLLQNFLEGSAHRFPDKVALIHKGERLNYQQIDEKSINVAQMLRSQGIQRGDRVAVFLDNSIESIVSLFGILKADAVFLMLRPTLKTQKLSYILNNCQAKALITHTNKISVSSGIFGSVPSLQFVIFTGNKDKIPVSNCQNPIFWQEIDSLCSNNSSNPSNPSNSINSQHVT